MARSLHVRFTPESGYSSVQAVWVISRYGGTISYTLNFAVREETGDTTCSVLRLALRSQALLFLHASSRCYCRAEFRPLRQSRVWSRFQAPPHNSKILMRSLCLHHSPPPNLRKMGRTFRWRQERTRPERAFSWHRGQAFR